MHFVLHVVHVVLQQSCTINAVDLLNSTIRTSCDQNFVVNIFYTVSWTIHAVYILNRTISLEHAVFRLFLWLYWSQYRGYKWDEKKFLLIADWYWRNELVYDLWYTKCIYTYSKTSCEDNSLQFSIYEVENYGVYLFIVSLIYFCFLAFTRLADRLWKLQLEKTGPKYWGN